MYFSPMPIKGLPPYGIMILLLGVFAKLIREQKPTHMSINLAIPCFRTLYESGLALNTFTSAKSGLQKTFYYGFDINLTDLMF